MLWSAIESWVNNSFLQFCYFFLPIILVDWLSQSALSPILFMQFFKKSQRKWRKINELIKPIQRYSNHLTIYKSKVYVPSNILNIYQIKHTKQTITQNLVLMSEELQSKREKYNICMVCDFFYPRLGGVEMHIF